MGRPKGSKNKPKQVETLVIQESKPSSGGGRNSWPTTLYLIMETKRGQKNPELHSYTEVKQGAISAIAILKEMRPGSKFEIKEQLVDWNKSVSIKG